MVDPHQILVGRDCDDVQLVHLVKLGRFRHGGAGHPRQLLVEFEEILEGDRGERLILLLDLHFFLGLDRLVQTVGPLAADHETAGELVDDDDLAVWLHHVVTVAFVEVVGLERIVDQVRPLHVARRVEAFEPGDLLGLAHAFIVQVAGPLLFLDLEMDVALELAGDPVGLGIFRHVVEGRARDDQRRARLVDQDAVHLVDDRVMQLALRLIILARLHVVAEIIEAELVIGAVSDVAGVDLLPFGGIHFRLDRSHGHSQTAKERAHPFGVAAGQVVVDRHHVHPVAIQGVQIRGQSGDQRLSFPGHHLGDISAVQDHAAHQLNVKVAHVEIAAARLPRSGERFGQEVLERLARVPTLAQLDRLGPQLIRGERLHRRL